MIIKKTYNIEYFFEKSYDWLLRKLTIGIFFEKSYNNNWLLYRIINHMNLMYGAMIIAYLYTVYAILDVLCITIVSPAWLHITDKISYLATYVHSTTVYVKLVLVHCQTSILITDKIYLATCKCQVGTGPYIADKISSNTIRQGILNFSIWK